MSGFFPLARTGPRPPGALPLAGSRHVWFDQLRRWPGGPVEPAGRLGAEDRARLAAPRPDLCGLGLDRPRLMGIVNVTPDSFSDGGRFDRLADALAYARALATVVDILDVGGESTRPGADTVPADEEIRRVVPVIEAIRGAGISTPISIDTRKAAVAAAALDAGADMINDVSAMSFDPEMAALAAERPVPICLMHAQGDPKTMQQAPRYDDVVAEVRDYLVGRVAAAEAAGIPRARVLVDPGIGFGKTLDHNLALLRALPVLHDIGCAVLLGASRKRFIGAIGGAPEPAARMPGSVAVALHGAAAGVQVIRVHDGPETRQALDLWNALNGEEDLKA